MNSFWGGELTSKNELTFEPDFAELTLTRATVVKGEAGKLWMSADGGMKFVIANLKGEHASAKLDLQLGAGNEVLTFSMEGKGVVHLTGYLNPTAEFDGDDDFDDEDVVDDKVLASNEFGVARIAGSDDDDDEDEDEDDEFDEDDEDDEDDLDLDGEEEKAASKSLYEDEAEEDDFGVEALKKQKMKKFAPPAAVKPVKPAAVKPVKRKAPESPAEKSKSPAASPAAKKVKSEGNDDAAWKATIAAHLKSGACSLATLGNSCKRPSGVSQKLKAFITANADTFKIADDGAMVSLV